MLSSQKRRLNFTKIQFCLISWKWHESVAKILFEGVIFNRHEKDFQLLQSLCVRVTEANKNIKARPRDNPVVDLW